VQVPAETAAETTRLKRPTFVSNRVASNEPDTNHVDIPKRFANLLGWDDSEADSSANSSANSSADSSANSSASVQCEDEAEVSESDESTDHMKKKRKMKTCFTDGQRIRHTIRHKIWIGTYDSSKDAIVHNGVTYRTISMFATAHVLADHNPNRASPRDGWKHCECEVQGKWVSTYDLPC
jgi:anti-sigma28 factor (negative regulator of flagellin synthesis)